MSHLRDLYVNTLGHQPESLRTSLSYLTSLALRSAIEIDKYLINGADAFDHTQELGQIIKSYHGSGDILCLYQPFTRAFGTDKSLRWTSEFDLEMSLLGAELSRIPRTNHTLPEMRQFLCTLSSELAAADWHRRMP